MLKASFLFYLMFHSEPFFLAITDSFVGAALRTSRIVMLRFEIISFLDLQYLPLRNLPIEFSVWSAWRKHISLLLEKDSFQVRTPLTLHIVRISCVTHRLSHFRTDLYS